MTQKAAKKTKQSREGPVVLEYNLYDLPTAQHKAGLAGLLMMIEAIKKLDAGAAPEVKARSTATARISFTQESIQTVFDELFAAEWVEVLSASKWQGKEPKRVEYVQTERNGKIMQQKRYVYDAVQPRGRFLETFLPGGAEPWLKLWRDMLWNTLRARPTTRGVYEERANGSPSSEAAKVWKTLVKEEQANLRGKRIVQPIASSLFLGAQDVNAERVPFQGEPRHNLLLYFWMLPSLVYAPRYFDSDGDWEDAGYVLVVPEPSDMDAFLDDIKQSLGQLDVTMAGYRPKTSLIAVPQEGGLDYLYHLAKCRVSRTEIAYSIVAVEVYHLEKRGNNVHMLVADRIVPNASLLDSYEQVRQDCRNPLYRAQRVRNILQDKPWYAGMDSLFASYPWEFFITRTGKTPRSIPFFGNDVRRRFDSLATEQKLMKGNTL